MKPRADQLVLAFVAAAALAWALVAAPVAAAPAPTPLSGTLRLAMCEGADCERPPEGAADWRSFVLGPGGIAEQVEHHEGVGWAVVSFTLTPELAALGEPALLFTTPADAEVATLNGVPAGGEGVIGRRYLAVPGGPRTLALPRAALRHGRNELVLKVLFAEISANVFSGPLLIGEQARVALERELLRRPLYASEAAFLSLFLLMIVLFVFLAVRGVVRSDYVLFATFLVLNTVVFLLDSHIVYDAGLASPWTEHAQALLRRSVTPVALALVTTVTGGRFGRIFAAFAAPAVVLVVLELFAPPLWSLHGLATPRKTVLGALGLYYLFLAARAIHARHSDAWPAFVGVIAYVVGSRLDLYLGIAARDYGTGAFALAMLFTITSRHARLRVRIEEISARLLDAHEEERRRIARDIHDSVGQSMLALRLKLQMLAGRDRAQGEVGETLPALAEDAGAIVEELRRTVLDLRPVFSDSDEYAPAMRGYAAAVTARRGLELHFHEGRQALPALAQRERTHLFRIFQEMLANVVRHAGAKRVDVSLHRKGQLLVLQVSDDGRGFVSGSVGGGIGLETMRERAELLGGTLAVASAPKLGTAITVEISLR